jgi:hypothetical protein
MKIRYNNNNNIKQLDGIDEFNLCLDNCGHWKKASFRNVSASMFYFNFNSYHVQFQFLIADVLLIFFFRIFNLLNY